MLWRNLNSLDYNDAPAPARQPLSETEIFTGIYHALGNRPETNHYNHLNQPRELVKAQAVTPLFA